MELISVIVPVYKVEKYLEDCINSIINQSYTQLEIILVDDGSPDRCGEICDAAALSDSRIRVIHKENGGLSDARNAGLEAASGSLIAFCDSDDNLHPYFLEALYLAMQKNGADIAECGINYVNEQGLLLKKSGDEGDFTADNKAALLRLIKGEGLSVTVWNKLYKSELLSGIRFEKGRLHEDEFFTYLAIDNAERIAVIKECLYNYRQRKASIISSGYSLRSLDGLEARFNRLCFLQKYPEIQSAAAPIFYQNCLYHLQMALTSLSRSEFSAAKKVILNFYSSAPKASTSDLGLSSRIRLWFFKLFPTATAAASNLFKIGL